MHENPFDEVGVGCGTHLRERNMADNTAVLRSSGVGFGIHNGGLHYTVTVNEQTLDFWPSSGKWYHRAKRRKGLGVFKFITYINEIKEKANGARKSDWRQSLQEHGHSAG